MTDVFVKGDLRLYNGSYTTLVPKSNVKKVDGLDSPDSRTEQEIRNIVVETVCDFYRRKGILHSYQIIRQMLRYEAQVGDVGRVRKFFEKHSSVDYDLIEKGFEVVDRVGRLCATCG